MARELTKATTDKDQIRSWVEERGGWPAEVASTERHGEPGILRIDFPGYSGEGSLKRISWEQWFEKFERADLVFLYQETTSDGERSNFNKLVSRETAEARESGGRTASRARAKSGGRREAPRTSAARTAGKKKKST